MSHNLNDIHKWCFRTFNVKFIYVFNTHTWKIMRAEILRLNKFLLNIIIIFVTSFSSLCIWMTIKLHYNTSCHITLCIHHDVAASYSGVHLSHKTLNYYNRCYSLAQPHLHLTVFNIDLIHLPKMLTISKQINVTWSYA